MPDKWLFAIKNLYRLMDRPKAPCEAIFKRLFNLAEISKYDTAERLAYQDSLKDYRDYYNTIASAKEDGLAEGLQKGEAIGLAKGRAHAHAHEAKIASALELHKTGMPLEQIAAILKMALKELSCCAGQDAGKPG